MKIALFAYGAGGLFHYACSLARGLLTQPAVKEIAFFTSSANNLDLLPASPNLQPVIHHAPHTMAAFVRWCCNWREQQSLKQSLVNFSPDIIHITDVYPVYPLHHRLLKKAPLIFTQHDPVMHSGESWRQTTHALQWYLARQSVKVIVHGHALKNTLATKRHIPRAKIAVIPMGIDKQPIVSPSTSQSVQSILFFGRIKAYKGLEVLLQSLIDLQKDNTPFHFTLAGTGNLHPYSDLLKKINRRRILNYYIPENKITSLFQEHDIIALPYHEATQSAVVTTALSNQRIIIATAVGALPEILHDGQNAMLVPPKNSTAFAAALKRVLSDHTLRKHLKQGAAQTARKYDWATIARQHTDLYENLRNPA